MITNASKESGDIIAWLRGYFEQQPHAKGGRHRHLGREGLGVSYSDINKMLRGRADEVSPEVRRKIVERHKYHEHKYTFAVNYMPLWLHEYEV